MCSPFSSWRQTALVLTLPVIALICAGTPSRAADEFDPKAADLLDKYVAATGGAAAYDAIRTRVIQAEMSVPARELTGEMITYLAAPNLFYCQISTSRGSQLRGSNGKTVWMIEPVHGPRILSGLERALVTRDSTLDRFAHWRELAAKVAYAGEEEVNGKKCARIVLTYKPAETDIQESPVTIHVDLASSLIVQHATEVSGPDTLATAVVTLDDYRKVDDLILPHKMTVTVDQYTSVTTVTNVENNPPIPAERFVLPRDIQKLLVQ